MKFKFLKGESLLFFLLFLFSLFLFIFSDSKVLLGVRSILEKPAAVVEGKVYKKKVVLEEPTEKERELLEALQTLSVDANKLSSCLEENNHLKKLLGAPLPADWHFLLANVLISSEEMIIDKGQKEGVKVGDMVILENIYIGQITWSGEDYSKVKTLASNSIAIPVFVKSKEGQIRTKGLLIREKNNLFVDRILQSDTVETGDLVVTSGDLNFRPGLLIGVVDQVLVDQAAAFKKAKAAYSLQEKYLENVFVIVK